ncbi:MAG: hypothetical protein NVSMB13_20010 [Mycobacteriales bacterium]
MDTFWTIRSGGCAPAGADAGADPAHPHRKLAGFVQPGVRPAVDDGAMREVSRWSRRRGRAAVLAVAVLVAPAGAWLAHAVLASPSAEAAPHRAAAVSVGDVSLAAAPAAITAPAAATAPASSVPAAATIASARLDALLAAAPTRVSVAAINLATGATFGYFDDRRYPTASVAKVNILAALLLQAQDSGRPLSADADELATSMIEQSDNDAADQLWERIGGAAGLAAADVRLGLTQTTPGTDGLWGLTTTSAADQLRLLVDLTSEQSPLAAPARAYLLHLMGAVEEDQAWGVSAAARPGDQLAVKNGWLPLDGDDGNWVVDSIGRLSGVGGTLLVAVLSDASADMDSGISVVQRAAVLGVSALSAG